MKINNEFTNENAHESTELDHVYLVQDEPISGTGDYFGEGIPYAGRGERRRPRAVALPRRSASASNQRHIWVFRVNREDLDQSIADEYLPIDWKAYGCAGSTEGSFDSAEGK